MQIVWGAGKQARAKGGLNYLVFSFWLSTLLRREYCVPGAPTARNRTRPSRSQRAKVVRP